MTSDTRAHTAQARLGRCRTCMLLTAAGAAVGWAAIVVVVLLPTVSLVSMVAMAAAVATAGVFTVLGLLHLGVWWMHRSELQVVDRGIVPQPGGCRFCSSHR